jgi:homoserine O-acetyltransferase
VDTATGVTTQRVVLFGEDDPLRLACGRELAPVEVAFETYGRLNADASNAVFVCHALTGDAHAIAPDGWWRTVVGPGLPVDPERFFVICPNLLTGCRGTTGPSTIDPRTGRPYGLDFPPITMRDLVAVHRRLCAHLGVRRLHAGIGGSLGGMQVLQWLLDHPDEVARAALVCVSSRLSEQNLALSAAARGAILADPGFAGGQYALNGTRPEVGLATARRLAHVTYLAEAGMERKFRRPPEPDQVPPADARDWLGSRYPVEHYLDHQAKVFLDRFDALSYLYLSRVMDGFDPFSAPGACHPDLRALVLSFSSDWRFGPAHGARIADALRARGAGSVERVVVETDAGHDAFLLDVPGYQERLAAFLAP